MSDGGTHFPPRLRVFFEAEILLVGAEIPDEITDAALRQAVQNETGFSGINVRNVTDSEREDDD
jgi:hypothetical protein